ncbi:glycosyltransferase family 4 protein [Butyrivibrio fibrisolvens]|uniref:glycosyltransferase family 4 protein n=1 Tax=Butyrivibrio fibrisolvens TaxID=831 RepID=UPI0003FAEC21|nr:glycosyltransferase family 1 protein [Butyrivibrio fibrisolvens]
MKYLECRYSRSGFGTYTMAQINTGLYDYFIVYDEFDSQNLDPSKIIKRDRFLKEVAPLLTQQDTVVATCNDLEGLSGIEDSKCNIILTLHDLTPLRLRYFNHFQKYTWRKKIKKAIYSSNSIITVSNYSKFDIINEFKITPDKVHVVYSYPQNMLTKIDQNYISKIKSLPMFTNTKYIISTVGALNPNKNFIRVAIGWKKSNVFTQSVLIAMSRKNNLIFKFLLFILGIKEKVYTPGYVSIEKLGALYSISDMYIFATLREGFGVPPLEAMQLSTPVLTSNTSCMEEVLKDSAIYINPYKISEISNGISAVLNNKEIIKSLVEKGLEKQREYNPERFLKEMSHVLNCY